MEAYTLIPTKLLRKLERAADLMLAHGPVKTELLGKKAFTERFGLTDHQWYHLIRTGSEAVVKRQGNGGKNVCVKVDATAYAKQFK